MTYLAKVRKCDLSKLAYELGEVVPPESRIIDLKRLILNSQSYEEEFAKQLLETLIEEREQTERAERERMEQTAQTEQAERIERERIEDRKRIEDRERIERKEQMVMEFELEKLRIQTTRGNNDTSRSTSNDAHYEIRKLMPKYESKDNDLSFYLILFERQAKRLGLDEDQWAFSLLGLLPYEMTQLIARETEEQSGDYRFVKRLLLKRYKLSPEQFRQKFEKHERSQKGSWRDFAFELRGYFNEWIEGMNVENFDALKDLSVTNQLKKKVPNVLRNHLIDDWTKLNNPDELADKLDEYENVRTEMGPPHWNAKHLIPPSFQQKSARFPNQSEVKETKQGTNVSGQDAARNEISETYPNTLRRMVNRAIRNDKGEPKCFNCNQFGHIARDCPAPRTTLTCRGCGQTGHKERNCTRPKEGLKVANLEVEGLETVPPDVYLKDVKIDNKETVKAMIDTGSSSCLMRESVARRISVDIEPDSTSLYGIGNQTAPAARTVGKTTVDLEIDGIVGREITVFIVNDDAQPYDLLIGRTWTDLPYVSFARIGKNLHIGYSSEFPFANLQEEIKSRRIELRATETVQLESDSINFTSAITDEVKDGYVLFTGVDDACVDSLLEVVDGKTTVPIISAGKGKLRVRKNQCVGRVELLNLDDIVVNLDVAEDSFQTKNEEKREGQDQMKRKRPILPEDINVNHSLTSKERQEILDVVNEYRDCFALGMEELGCTDVTKMDIKEVDGSKPVCLRPYKTTASEREAIREIVREWKDNGIVTETRSPYASPVLLVRKKTGDHRLVVDYRRLNIQTVKDKFPLPRIDDLLEGLRNAKFFTTLDLAHGYLQIPLTDKAKLKTAFITPDDTGQFERMIFGLANAPAEFQRLMHTVLGPLLNKKAFCYLDDVIIPAKDWREMIERLREVLERIRSAKLTLKPSKCEFGRREVEFLGYVISTGGLKPGPRKIKAIEEFPEPKNVHDIRRFLGLTNFFRRFVKDFARKAEPLSRLTKKGSQFEWKEEQRRSFGGLRKDLVEYPVLAHYNPELKTEVHCDASAEGLAGMVLQMDEDCKWRLVYCVSKKTTEAEKMYHSSKLELMAIVWTLDRLRQFLVGIKFTVVTDCQALVYMNAKKTTNPQIARWYNLIQEYDFEIRHKPGEKMAHVDGMSRAPVDDPRDTMEEIVEKNLEVCLTITLEEQILMIQHSDPELRDLIQIFRKDPCDRTVGEQNRINDYSYRRKSGRGARSRRYPPTQPTTFLQRKVQSRTIEIQEWPNNSEFTFTFDGTFMSGRTPRPVITPTTMKPFGALVNPIIRDLIASFDVTDLPDSIAIRHIHPCFVQCCSIFRSGTGQVFLVELPGIRCTVFHVERVISLKSTLTIVELVFSDKENEKDIDVLHRSLSHFYLDSTLLYSPKLSSRSFSKSRSHNSSCEASAAEISSASVDERDTQPCFPVIHEMGFEPSRNKFPLSDFLSVLSLAHVASLYASSVGGFWLDMRSSSSLVVFRYLTILFAAFQSQFLGFWVLLLSMQTGAAISGLDTTLSWSDKQTSLIIMRKNSDIIFRLQLKDVAYTIPMEINSLGKKMFPMLETLMGNISIFLNAKNPKMDAQKKILNLIQTDMNEFIKVLPENVKNMAFNTKLDDLLNNQENIIENIQKNFEEKIDDLKKSTQDLISENNALFNEKLKILMEKSEKSYSAVLASNRPTAPTSIAQPKSSPNLIGKIVIESKLPENTNIVKFLKENISLSDLKIVRANAIPNKKGCTIEVPTLENVNTIVNFINENEHLRSKLTPKVPKAQLRLQRPPKFDVLHRSLSHSYLDSTLLYSPKLRETENTAIVTVDISGAFDNAWHPAILQQLDKANFPATQKITTEFDVLHRSLSHSYLDSTLLYSPKLSSRSFSKSRSHNSSCEASAAEISSASVDERDTQPCFPVIHEMGFEPSRNKFPLSDFLSVLSLAHVASLYASSVGGFWLDMRSSSSLVVFRYLTILFAAFQSQFLGFWFLLLSMQTGAAISGLDTTLRGKYYGGCFLSNETIFERSRFARAGMLHTTLVPIDLESSGEFIFIRYHDFCNMGGERLTLQVEQTIRTLSKEGNSYSVIVKKLKAEGLDVGKATICRVVNGIGKKREAESNGQKFQVDRPRPVRTPATVSKVKRLATTENPPSQRQLSRMCGTSLKTINNIIHKDLELDTRRKGKVHKLTPFQMKNRATNARKLYEEHLGGSRSEYTATLDESWMYVTYCNGIRKICYIKRGNQVPDNWVHQCSETFPKGFMVVGVMTGRGVLPLIKVPSKVKVNSEFYIECVLKPVIEQLKDLYPGEMDKVFLHHDKASSHTSNKTQQFLQEMKDTLGLNFIRNSDIPVKSPDASPLDFYGFGMLKQRLFNRRPKTEAGLWKAAQEEWSNVSLSKVKEVFAAWKVRCREIAKKKGKHIEHMKKIHVRKIKF
ncbi:hypothetical protein LAZ67_1008068 [Cordylochernes scorpioides]|uniref:RNA-directed DNA polymerase n=1 Tax=Cordylochernes scorpioides TaxID=51811 RepID=A0ABY6JZP3_9ARAC|nr:hypothetical protein LAZ67_1008068 [Cordylochernes scorpioides]